jgi:hypothetical protein
VRYPERAMTAIADALHSSCKTQISASDFWHNHSHGAFTFRRDFQINNGIRRKNPV